MPSQPAIVAAALEYIRHGIQPVLLRPNDKRPVHKGWQLQQLDENKVVHLFTDLSNLGAKYGPVSGGLIDVEFDSETARRLAPQFLPATRTRFGRKSKPDSHWLYRCPDLHNGDYGGTISLKGADGKEMVSIRIGGDDKGSYSMVPPSIHPTGEPVEWSEAHDFDPSNPNGVELIARIRYDCIAAMLSDHWPVGNRHDVAMAVAGWLVQSEVPQAMAELIIRAAATDAKDDEVKDRIRAVKDTYRKYENGDQVKGWSTLGQLIDGRAAKALRQVLSVKSTFPNITKDGRPLPTVPNTMVALKLLEVECKYDLFALQYVVSGHQISEFSGEMSDPALFRLSEMIHDKFRFYSDPRVVMGAIKTLANHHRFHPVCDYLDSLRWDGQPRIDDWLSVYGGADNTAYTRAVGALVLVAACRRVREPGVKFDETLVLEGAQGTNKSSALQVLAIRKEWFSDDMSLDLKAREAIEQTSGVWIVEIPELRGLRSDRDRRKSFQSRQKDRARLAYGYTPTIASRQYIAVGTTNEENYLDDPTGNRRFWPVQIDVFDLESLRMDVDQLWAEAAAREASGVSIELDLELWPAAADVQNERSIYNPFEDTLDTVLGDMTGKIKNEDLWTILNILPGQRSQRHNEDFGKALKNLGWIKDKLRFGGGPKNCYTRGEEPHQVIIVEPRLIENGVILPAKAKYEDEEPVLPSY